MTLEMLQQLLEEERRGLEDFSRNVEREIAYRRGRIDILAKLIEEVGHESDAAKASTEKVS